MSATAWPMAGTDDPDAPIALVLSPWLRAFHDTVAATCAVRVSIAPSMPELPLRLRATWRPRALAMGRPGR